MSKYIVVRYVPDPIAEEFVNIGVIVFDGERTLCKFLDSWERVENFNSNDIQNIKDFVERINLAVKEGKWINKEKKAHINIIQFSEPRGSLEDGEDLLEDCVKTYLVGDRK